MCYFMNNVFVIFVTRAPPLPGMRLLIMLVVVMTAVCFAALPPGYDDELWCPPGRRVPGTPLTGYGSVPVTHRTFAGHCLAPKKQPAGYAGPRVVFNKCVHTVDKTEKVPTPWGVNLGSAPLFLRFAATGGGPRVVTSSLSVRNEKRDQLIKDRKNHNQFTFAPMCRLDVMCSPSFYDMAVCRFHMRLCKDLLNPDEMAEL